MRTINYKPKLTKGIFKEILSAIYDVANNTGVDSGRFEGHSWDFNPYGFYCNPEEFESEEEFLKWEKRLDAHRSIIYDEAEDAIKQLEWLQIDPVKWASTFLWGNEDTNIVHKDADDDPNSILGL